MRTIQVDGHTVTVHDERIGKHKTLPLIARVQNKDLAASIEFCDRMFEGGYAGLGYILDPVDGDPQIDETVDFMVKVLAKLAEDKDIKNSLGSQILPAPASQRLEPTCNSILGSTTTITYAEE